MAARTGKLDFLKFYFYNDLEDYPNSTFLYDEDYNDEVCDTTSVVEFASVVTPAFFSMVITLSLAGNILVLVILAKYENLKSLTNIFILNLAISDLVFTFGLPFWASYHIWGWTFGWILCKTVNFVFYTGFYSSILFLTVMTFHRYLAVVYPLSDHGSQRGCYGVTVSLVIWMVSFGVAVPALIFSSVQNHVHDKGYRLYCEYNDLNWRNFRKHLQSILQKCFHRRSTMEAQQNRPAIIPSMGSMY
ncbi:chemokine XC receptor 1 isoform X4 [Esox lucius]|uniref:chemokine XC receptor 1 isoform X4 n=1 Tax=Esox lucius TaxID=8010 RepID=UPI00097325D5|nr:chemokine XC receptor 1 isoform X4 [Esox lucius]